MARQAQTPVQFSTTTRTDSTALMSSGRAGKVIPAAYIPVLRGDSVSGSVGIDVELAEMPRPLQNGVGMNVQAWFVPKSAHPKFSGREDYEFSYQKEPINTLANGVSASRQPENFFTTFTAFEDRRTISDSDLFRSLGLHSVNRKTNTDLIDAFNLVYNFRLAAHSSRLVRRPYASEDLVTSTALPRAFWPKGRFSQVVPDYERALIVGDLQLDVQAGQIPINGLFAGQRDTNGPTAIRDPDGNFSTATHRRGLFVEDETVDDQWNALFAEMGGQSVAVTLADIDKARTTQAFAKLRTAYAGNDATGFDNDDALVATLMQGFQVPADMFKRPWLLDSSMATVGFTERFATDSGNLDQSVTQGTAAATLSLNVPKTEVDGVIIVTLEVLPERLDERQSDEWLHYGDPIQYPNALRDVQRPEPVDIVTKSRIDHRHDQPGEVYGYEPMNNVWNRAFTRLGGDFYQKDPENPFIESRAAIWQTSIVNPELTEDHWLAPDDFPHDVFADTEADAFEFACRHSVAITGITQIGDVLEESNDDYDAVREELEN